MIVRVWGEDAGSGVAVTAVFDAADEAAAVAAARAAGMTVRKVAVDHATARGVGPVVGQYPESGAPLDGATAIPLRARTTAAARWATALAVLIVAYPVIAYVDHAIRRWSVRDVGDLVFALCVCSAPAVVAVSNAVNLRRESLLAAVSQGVLALVATGLAGLAMIALVDVGPWPYVLAAAVLCVVAAGSVLTAARAADAIVTARRHRPRGFDVIVPSRSPDGRAEEGSAPQMGRG